MADTIKARFVGGPWHNRVVAFASMNLLCVRVVEAPKVPASVYLAEPDEPYSAEKFSAKEHRYYLHRFFQGDRKHPTFYEQYVHESLIIKGEPIRETYSDPPLPELPPEIWQGFDWEIGSLATKFFRGA